MTTCRWPSTRSARGRSFYQTFGPGFVRQSKFMSEKSVPQLGDENTPYEQVAKFYKVWMSFSCGARLTCWQSMT